MTHTLSTAELLGAWERGLGHPSTQRALALLEAAYPETTVDALSRLSIGQRDSRLLALREMVFGADMAALVTCPSCGENLELTMNMADLKTDPGADTGFDLLLSVGEYNLRIRPPNSVDMTEAAFQPNVELVRRSLLDRCILEASIAGAPVLTADLPGDVLEAAVD